MKRLYKSYTDKRLAGVCGGIAQILGIDSTIVRGIWALFTLFLGVGLVIYILLAFLLPYSDTEIVLKTKKIYKSESDRKIAGVCGGIAQYLEMDSSMVRIFFIVLVLLFGTGILEYFVLAWVMPSRDSIDF